MSDDGRFWLMNYVRDTIHVYLTPDRKIIGKVARLSGKREGQWVARRQNGVGDYFDDMDAAMGWVERMTRGWPPEPVPPDEEPNDY